MAQYLLAYQTIIIRLSLLLIVLCQTLFLGFVINRLKDNRATQYMLLLQLGTVKLSR